MQCNQLMQCWNSYRQSNAQAILDRLPERIRTALIARAAEIEYPVEAVVEMAIASYPDEEALGFADCKPHRGEL